MASAFFDQLISLRLGSDLFISLALIPFGMGVLPLAPHIPVSVTQPPLMERPSASQSNSGPLCFMTEHLGLGLQVNLLNLLGFNIGFKLFSNFKYSVTTICRNFFRTLILNTGQCRGVINSSLITLINKVLQLTDHASLQPMISRLTVVRLHFGLAEWVYIYAIRSREHRQS